MFVCKEMSGKVKGTARDGDFRYVGHKMQTKGLTVNLISAWKPCIFMYWLRESDISRETMMGHCMRDPRRLEGGGGLFGLGHIEQICQQKWQIDSSGVEASMLLYEYMLRTLHS